MPDYWPFSILRHSALRERLVMELDHGGRQEALRMVNLLAGTVGMFKVGKHLFMQAGPDLLREIRRQGGEVFLDLKFQDTPRMLSQAAAQATRLGVKMFDLHPSYPYEAMERMRGEISRLCQNEGLRRPYMVAVAMYMSLVRREAAASHPPRDEQIARLARMAAAAVVDGVMTRPEHAGRIRASCGRRFLIVTSGASAESSAEDVGYCGVAQAVRSGTDYVVVGRPIWEAHDPLQAVREILAEMERGFRAVPRNPTSLVSERTLLS